MRKLAVLILVSSLAQGWVIPSAAGAGSKRAIRAASPTQASLVDDYEILLLTAPPPLTDSAGYRVGAGQVAGVGRIAGPEFPDETYAVYWPEGSITGINLHPPNFRDSAALDTNGQQQVGYANGPRTGFTRHAWMWNGDANNSEDLHPAGIWNDSIARAIAGSQQVGNVNYYDQDTIIIHAALWSGTASSAVDLHPPIADCDRSYAEDTDGVHQVGYGYFVTPDNLAPYRALLWEGSAESAVVLHPPDFTHSFAEGVAGNEQVGQAFNTLEGDGYTRALLWHGSAESVISLHSDAYLATTAYGTNGIHQVGFGETSDFPSAAHALRWSGTAGSVVDLHSLLPEEFSLGSSFAYDVDAEGNIAGVARRPDGSTVAVLWRALGTPDPTPTPTPTPNPTPTPTPQPEPPVVTAVGPTSGSPAGGTTVTLSGANFAFGALVSFGSIPGTDVVFGGETQLSVSSPPLIAGSLYDVTVVNPGGSSGTIPAGWLADFNDVPQTNLFHADIETLFRSAVSAGCGGGNYCPAAVVTRSQMAVFLLKAKHGALYAPPPATGAIFSDVPANAFAAAWIEQLFAEGNTGGCGGGNYCPDAVVTRAQMAVMLLRAEHGSAYSPPSCTGVFVDVPCGPAPAFAVDWIEQFAAEGITAGCGGDAYCPGNATQRGNMATFLVRTFDLPALQD
jgi:IPT/TIG domain-containing protein